MTAAGFAGHFPGQRFLIVPLIAHIRHRLRPTFLQNPSQEYPYWLQIDAGRMVSPSRQNARHKPQSRRERPQHIAGHCLGRMPRQTHHQADPTRTTNSRHIFLPRPYQNGLKPANQIASRYLYFFNRHLPYAQHRPSCTVPAGFSSPPKPKLQAHNCRHQIRVSSLKFVSKQHRHSCRKMRKF